MKIAKVEKSNIFICKGQPRLDFFDPGRADSNIFINSRLEKNNSANKILKFEK